jgi:hypothetical protein
MSLLLRGIR